MITTSMNFLVKEKCSPFQLKMLKQLNRLKIDGKAVIWYTSTITEPPNSRIDITIGVTTYVTRKNGSNIYTKSDGIERMHYDEELAARWMAKNALETLNTKITYMTNMKNNLKIAIGDDNEIETD